MKKLDLGQIVSILANVGVIFGIVLLAFELRQNNELLRAEVGQQFLQNRIALPTDIYRDPTLAEIYRKLYAEEELTALERTRLEVMFIRIYRNFEWDYSQFEQGMIAELPLSGWRATVEWGKDSSIAAWVRTAPAYAEDSPGFAQFMNENIFGIDE